MPAPVMENRCSCAGAAHSSGMSTSSVNRQPQGIPAGGQFAPASYSEPAVTLVAEHPITLSPGESEDFTEYADGDVITRLSVLRSDDGGTFHVEASKFLNFKDIIPAVDLGTDEAGRDAWLDTHSLIIENYLRDRYDAEADANDWEDVRAECGVSIQADSTTESPNAGRVRNRSEILRCAAHRWPHLLLLCSSAPLRESNSRRGTFWEQRGPSKSPRAATALGPTHGLWQRHEQFGSSFVPPPTTSGKSIL